MSESVTPGARFGPFEILAPLGAGGMGEVFRARDSRLKRDVAIKVLPAAFARDRDRLARFQREAEVLASLNHPNIAAIYGFEEGPAASGIVLELVDGEGLAELIARGPLPLDVALPILRQIADALDAAHERGIVHRDLKPANVKIASNGTVKILDFGLAKLTDSAAAIHPEAPDSMSPTITPPAMMTGVGLIVGTAAYMSPEQARGRAVDKRTDIWAFGCVLYEMLTGRRAFVGDGATETIGAVIHKEPDWSALGADTPQAVRLVLQRCLQKDVKQRFRDIGDVRLALDGAFEARETTLVSAPARRRSIAVFAGIASVAAALTAGVVWSLTKTPAAVSPVRFTLGLPSSIQPERFHALSPDGRHLVFFGSDGGPTRLFVHSFETAETRMLQSGGVSGAPFWSADSRSIGYVGEGRLKKIDLSGGPPEAICDASGFAGGSWNQHGDIVFAAGNRGLMRVPAAGGTPTLLTAVDQTRKESSHTGPWFLPDGRHVLYLRSSADAANAGAYVASLDVRPEEQPLTRVLATRQNPQYASSSTGIGHLIFMRDSALMAQPFDPNRVTLSGEALRIVDQVGTSPGGTSSYGFFWVSNADALVYRRGQAATGSVTWISRTGQETAAPIATGVVSPNAPKLSPDGRRLALIVGGDLWVYDLEGRPPIRLTFGGSHNAPLWTPDGSRIAHEQNNTIVALPADGSGGAPEPMSPTEGHFHPHGWSADGKYILLVTMGRSNSDLVKFSLSDKGEPQPVVATPANEGPSGASLSPDGRWLAYVSDETGAAEIWVRPFPGPGAAVRISPNGGVEPLWAKNGRELYYLEQNRMMAVAVDAGERFNFKPATLLFQSRYQHGGQPPTYDVAADGRFVMIKPAEQAVSSFNVILNWSASRVPAAH